MPTLLATPDAVTKRWMRNASDEKAAANGCRFDEARGQFVVDWIQRYCRLYEGERAGQTLTLDDWQYECTMRLFGWVKHSEDWGREVRRFRRAGVWIPKKNGKSPTLAAWGLYLFCGDGEPGQKVYSVAKDGKQAMIAHTHALEMVRRSPHLSRECQINKSTGQITHLPTSSVYRVVAGDNPNSQEGLNGSVMVDETHVVDRRLMSILLGAGISRSEPLQIEVSTAGSNPEGYGKEQWDWGKEVESGEREDEGFFFQSYAAPPNLADADLAADPRKWGELANPTWGRIVKPGEFLDAYNASKHSLVKLADFKMYRLNVWQRSSSPWLRESDWEKCRRSYTLDDLLGRDCYAGLDLSKTQDMTALVLVFPEEGEEDAYCLLPFFWLPEVVVQEKGHLAPFKQWARQGYLELTPGSTLDYGFVRTRFRQLHEKVHIKKLVFDPTYAEETTQALEQGVLDASGNVIEAGTGVPREQFPQRLQFFANPTKEFERLVIAGKMHHNGHPILTWQAGHVHVRTDYNQNPMPVKPSRMDVRKIDGIAAAIMALSEAMKHERGSVYESRGIELL